VVGYTKMAAEVTHPSINRARRRVTPLIETNVLPLGQDSTYMNANNKKMKNECCCICYKACELSIDWPKCH